MEFFLPQTNLVDRDKGYETIKRFAEEQRGKTTSRKIFKVKFFYAGRLYEEEVGKETKLNGEIVFAIFETDTMYLVCTANRGVLRGDPMLISKQDIKEIIDFDE